MLRHILRRLLWLLPTLGFLTLASFALLSYVPDPADDAELAATLGEDRVDELRRARFLDLPRFFNPRPLDARARVDELVPHLLAGDPREAARASATLLRLGGAILPYWLPRLDAFDPESRAKLALALAPLAERMGLDTTEARDPERASIFWSRFFADRENDFRASSARRAVRRLALQRTPMREADLRILDTFALDEIFLYLREHASGGDVETQRNLIDVTAHITGRADTIPDGASRAEAKACVKRWLDWWLANRGDYATYDGPARLFAMVGDTQYARWFERMISLELGHGEDGVPIVDKLRERAPRSFAIAALSVLMAYAVAQILGIFSVLRRGIAPRGGLLALTLLAHATPTACIATLFAARFPEATGFLLPALVLALAFVASPARHLQTRLVETLQLDFIRAARARGLGEARVVLSHAFRGTLGQTLTLLSLDVPMALAGSFVVEKAFGIPGLGEETIRAVETRDVAWLMTLGFGAAVLGALALLFGDIALSLVDPRVRIEPWEPERSAE